MVLYLENKIIGQYITYSRGLDLLKQCLIDFSKNKVIQPLRTRIPINCENGLFLNMSCYSESLGVLGAKLLTLYPRNTTCPVHQGTILLYNEINGSPQAVLDAEYITGLRTSIVSTIASQCFAKKTSKVMSIIGCGEEAKWHVKSHLNWKDWEKIYVMGKSFEEAKEFSDKLNEEYGKIILEPASDKKTVLLQSDVICTVTSSSTPVLSNDMIKQGCHINAVGAPFPDRTELDMETVKKSKIISDSTEAALKESGDMIKYKAEIICELGEYLDDPGRFPIKREETTIFKSLGLAVEDLVIAKEVFKEYIKRNK